MSSCDVLMFLKRTGKGKLSELLLKEGYVDNCGGSDSIVAQIDKYTAKGFVKLKHEYDVEEGDDFLIELTESGKAFLRYRERQK